MNTRRSIKAKIISHLDGDIGQEEQQDVLIWISNSEENARYYAEIKDIWEASQTNLNKIADTEQEWKRFVARSSNYQEKKNIRIGVDWRRISSIAAIAAIFIAGIFIGIASITLLPSNQQLYCTAVAPKGSISQIVLPDSTVIFLNADSEIKYSVDLYSPKRDVFLKGEAWFKVAKDKKRPLIVHTDFYDVQVLGTKFNVKAYNSESRVETTLEEGSIQILSTDKVKLIRPITLKPGEQMVYNKETNSFQVKEVEATFYSSWKENKLEFVKMSLKELLVLLERKYGVEFEVIDPEILNYHYSGTIENESILDILNILEHTLALRHKIENHTIKLYKN